MNSEQIMSIIRQIMLFGGGFLVTRGWVDDTNLQVIVGAIITIGSSIWATYTRRNTGLIASAADLKSVTKIETTSQTAQALPTTKVVAPQ